MSAAVRGLGFALAVVAIGCRNDGAVSQVQKPPAPVMQPLLEAYAAPSAALTGDVLVELGAGVAQRVATADALAIDQRVIAAASGALAQLQARYAPSAYGLTREDLGVTAQPLTLQGDGFLVVTRICDGWGPVPVPDIVNNGFMELTVGFTEQGVDPVIWGALSVCKYLFGPHRIHIDGLAPDPRAGDVRLFIGNNVQVATFGAFTDPVLVELTTQVIVDDRELAGQLSFRIDLNTRWLEVLVPLPTGHVIAGVAATRGNLAHVRALNGSFDCDLAALRCTAFDGTVIGAP